MPTCEDYIARLTDNRNQWAIDSNNLEGSAWDAEFEAFNDREADLLKEAGGHPTGPKPRRRPY